MKVTQKLKTAERMKTDAEMLYKTNIQLPNVANAGNGLYHGSISRWSEQQNNSTDDVFCSHTVKSHLQS